MNDERDAWLLLMNLFEIPREFLVKFQVRIEEDLEFQQVEFKERKMKLLDIIRLLLDSRVSLSP